MSSSAEPQLVAIPSRAAVIRQVDRLKGLPSFPEVLRRLDEELRSSDPSPRKVAHIIEEDAALSARFLAAASTVAFSGHAPPTVVGQAVTRLGLEEVRRQVTAAAVLKRFATFGGKDPRQFWYHSLAVGLTARVIAETADPPGDRELLDTAFTAGLLHDLGVIVFIAACPKAYAEVCRRVEESGQPAVDVELETMEIGHGEVGERIASQWGLARPLREVIAHHHEPWNAHPDHRRLVQFVHIANFVCNNQGYGRAEDGFHTHFCPSAWDATGYEIDQIGEIIERTRQAAEQSVHYLPAA